MIKTNSNNTKTEFFHEDDDLDLRVLLNFLIRNKKLITILTLIAAIFSYFLSKKMEKVWEGDFQIVLETNEGSSKRASSESIFGNLAGILDITGNSSNSLETQVAILKSSSVLEPVFNYVNLEKNITNQTNSFSNWLNSNLEIELLEKTSVLNISYQDKNKDLIIPVLDRISDAYQIYSGKNKKRNFALTKTYLLEQIESYKKKSSNSLKALQKYAADQDLTLLSSNQISRDNDLLQNMNLLNQNSPLQLQTSRNVISNIDIENIRVDAANKIRNIDSQIRKIKEIENSDQLRFLNTKLSAGFNIELTSKIKETDLIIIDLKSRYTDKENSIKRLEEKKEFLVKQQKESLIRALEAEKILAQAEMESAKRPKGVILKYKELIRNADRDEKILVSLENELRVITLEEAKLEDPWELITKPRLKQFPVKPEKNKIRLIGILIGLLSGIIISLFREKKSGLLHDEKSLEKIFNTQVITNIGINKVDDNLEIINDIYLMNKNKKFKFYIIGIENINKIKFLEEFLSDKEINYSIETKLENINKDSFTILVTSLGVIKKEEILSIKKRLDVLNFQFSGIILLNKLTKNLKN